MGSQKPPGVFFRFRPALPEDAAANLAVVGQLPQSFLHGDADIAADAGRAVSVDQLEQQFSLLACSRQLAVETRQSFLHLRHIRLEVYDFDGNLSLVADHNSGLLGTARFHPTDTVARARVSAPHELGLSAPADRVAGFLVRGPA